MKKCGGQRGGIHAHVRENMGDLQKMRDIGIAGAAELIPMALRGNFVGATNYPRILGRPIFAKFFEEFFEARLPVGESLDPAGSLKEHYWETAC